MRTTACFVVVLILAGCAERKRPLGVEGAPEEVGHAISRLADQDPDERFQARHALTNLGAPAIPHLVAALRDDNPDVRAGAAAALGGMHGTDRSAAVTALAAATADPDADVRFSAVESLMMIGPPAHAAGPALARALKDDEVRVRRGAGAALVRVLGKEAVPLLRDALSDARARRYAVFALGQLGADARDAVPALEHLAADEPQLRPTVDHALDRIRATP